ncbi:MAG: Patched family protein, partial [Gammaproteobacteria bacterium]|nr:Patched family protein [Gammaproteobacteria bacterium]
MKNINQIAKLSISILSTLFLFSPAIAAIQDEHPIGLDIAHQINARDEGVSVSRNLTMEMIDRRGKKRVRETRGFRKYYGDEKRTVIFYLKPRNVKKTAFLTYDYPQAEKDDDQWLY